MTMIGSGRVLFIQVRGVDRHSVTDSSHMSSIGSPPDTPDGFILPIGLPRLALLVRNSTYLRFRGDHPGCLISNQDISRHRFSQQVPHPQRHKARQFTMPRHLLPNGLIGFLRGTGGNGRDDAIVHTVVYQPDLLSHLVGGERIWLVMVEMIVLLWCPVHTMFLD